MKKRIFLLVMLAILLTFIGTSVFAQQVSSREMERLVNSAVEKSDRAYRLANQNYNYNEREIDSLVSQIEKDLYAIERLQNKGEVLTSNQERKIQGVIANGVAIIRLREQANR